jgi:hypothetical protein
VVTLVLNSWQQDNALSEWILEVIADDWSSETPMSLVGILG